LAVCIDLNLLREQRHLELEVVLVEDYTKACEIVAPFILKDSPLYKLVFDLAGQVLVLKMSIEAKLSKACDLCLEDAEVELLADTEYVFSIGDSLDDEDIIFIPPSVVNYDLAPLLLESLLYNLPIKVVCCADCKGLCPGCGVNLNRSKCDCHPLIDIRWSKLQEYKENMEK
jgi:uncharacterized protein